MTTESIRNAADANELLQKLKSEVYGGEIIAPINVDEIARLLEIDVREDTSLEAEDVIGKIEFIDGNPVISLNPLQNLYEARRRFTLAHELGHFILHSRDTKKEFKDSIKQMSRKESYWDFNERQANEFAAQLLMPIELIEKEGNEIIDSYLRTTGDGSMPVSNFIAQMARTFKVSTQSMEYRLKNLRIIT